MRRGRGGMKVGRSEDHTYSRETLSVKQEERRGEDEEEKRGGEKESKGKNSPRGTGAGRGGIK
jgi:hypothetical protein